MAGSIRAEPCGAFWVASGCGGHHQAFFQGRLGSSLCGQMGLYPGACHRDADRADVLHGADICARHRHCRPQYWSAFCSGHVLAGRLQCGAGGLRAAAQMLSYEVFMGLSLMGVVLMAGSFSMSAIVEAQRKMWFVIPQFLGFVLFLIAGVAETRRLPFDIPEAESELVAGFHSEYSGMKFGMFFVGEYVGVVLISALISILFFGGWLGPVLPPIVWFLIKMFFFIGFFILLRAALPRPRFDQLMDWGWKLMLPLALANLLVTGAIVLAVR